MSADFELPQWIREIADAAVTDSMHRDIGDFIAAVTAITFGHYAEFWSIIDDCKDPALFAGMAIISCGALLQGRAEVTGESLETLMERFAAEVAEQATEWSRHGDAT